MAPELEIKVASVNNLINGSNTETFFHSEIDNTTGTRLIALGSLPRPTTVSAVSICGQIQEKIIESFFSQYPIPAQASIMEERLANLNHALKNLKSSSGKWLEHLTCALIEINGNQMSAALTADAIIYVLRNGSLHDISARLDDSSVNSGKFFPSFLAGKIQAEDYFFIASKPVFNYISLDRLKNALLNSADLNEAALIISETISNASKGGGSFIALAISVQPPIISRTENKIRFNFKRLSKIAPSLKLSNKISSLLLLVVAVILLASSVVFIKNTVAQNKQTKDYSITDERIQSIEEKITAAEAAIIRKDKKLAGNLMNEVGPDLADLSAKLTELSSDHQPQVLSLQNRWEKLFSSLTPK